MRRRLVIVGIVLMVIGVLPLIGSILIDSTSTSVAVPADAVDELTPSGIGGTTFTATWSGGDSGTTVYLTSGAPTCTNPQGLAASASGASGTISATLTSGTTYGLYACSNGQGEALTFSYTTAGISPLVLIGIVLIIVGALIGAIGLRGRSNDEVVMMDTPPPPEA
jgi:hypothetical protein